MSYGNAIGEAISSLVVAAFIIGGIVFGIIGFGVYWLCNHIEIIIKYHN